MQGIIIKIYLYSQSKMRYINNVNNNFGVIDLFSGCGGSAVGFEKAGLPIKVAVDIDKHASESFKINFPNAEVFTNDISYISGKELMKAGKFKNGNEVILIACPPCQGFSNARRNSERLTDPRNKLIYEFLRIVEEIKPYAFVLENVPGLAKNVGKPIFIQILQRLQELGYQTVYDVIDTADYGVPQRRKRLVMLGTKDQKLRLTFPSKTNADPAISSDLPPWKTVRQAIDDLLPIKAGQKLETDAMHMSANLSELNIKRMKQTPHDGGDRLSWSDDLVLECHKNFEGHRDVYGRMRWDSPSPTITGGCAMVSKGRFGHPEQNRAISLREAARLQTFPDNFKFIGNFGQIAKQLGNAVPPLLGEIAAKTLLKSISDLKAAKKLVPKRKISRNIYRSNQLNGQIISRTT